MSSQNHPHQIQTFSSGAAYDSDPELIFSKEASGVFIDAHNAQPTSNDGNTGSLEKIQGEVLLHPNLPIRNGYKCIGSEVVNEYLIEFWAPTNPAFPGIARVNGVVVLESMDFPLKPAYPLQWDKNRAAQFSEIVITDDQPGNPPYLFNINDMVSSVSTNKYFSNFDPELYQLNLQSSLDTMAFQGLINVGGGGGLPVGHYQWQMRSVSKQGDRTRWSHQTPMVAIPQALSSDSREYPWIKTFGGPPKPDSVTAFAPVFRFRVTNLYNYDYIEIKRISHNSGAGIEFTPNGKIVARIDIGPGEISVREYIDPSGSNVDISLSSEDETQELAYISNCKSIRYHDRRLVPMNVTLASREASLTFKQINEKEGFPIIEKLGTAGYNDPYNHTFKKSEMRGEIVGYGCALYDGVGNDGFVTKIPQLKKFQFPNRRDPISGETLAFSTSVVRAAEAQDVNNVTNTHEVFDHINGIAKEDLCSFKNIIEEGRVLGLTGSKKLGQTGGVTQDCDETKEQVENHGTDVGILNNVRCSYQPFTPIRQTDPDVTGHNYIVNTKVAKSKVSFGIEKDHAHTYRPACFAPEYYAMGIMVAGVQNFPKWAKSFAIVRTNAARRVLCQGLAYYSMTKAEFKAVGNASLGGKEKNKFWFYSPDIENGILSSDTMNDIIDNPQNYKLQFVSPLGFFSEWYSAEDSLLTERDRCVDMMLYARMLFDQQDGDDDKINPFESPNMGIPGGDGRRYISYDKFRNQGAIPSTFSGHADKGNRLFDIANIKRKSEGRGAYLDIETIDDVYATSSTGGNSEAHFEDSGCQNFTEPLYIVNIIRTGATINDNDIQKYRQTTHYQKLESIIGKSNGNANQVFELVDERWEDAIPDLSSSGISAGANRFIYIKKPDGTEEKWQNVTFKTPSQKSTIIAQINANVISVKGIYTHENVDGLGRKFNIHFNQAGFTPVLDSFIVIKYDDNAPIRVFGGDTYISETIFSPIDKQASARDKSAETQFAWGIGLPYKNFKINPRYYTIRKAGASINAIQDKEWFLLGFIRQLCVMFCVESRGANHLAYNQSEAPNQFFPLINYVIRPNRWDADKGYKDNQVFEDYNDDYGGQELSSWKWGGFRFKQQVNPDYSCEPPISFFSKPEFGFTEQLHFPTRAMWSLPRAINVQNSPGLRTFPANNSFDIDDDCGEIKRGWDALSDGGENLYAVTNTGVCLLLTKKSILTDLNGGDLGYMAADGFIKHQIWRNREVGMYDEFWRGAAEANIAILNGDGSESRIDALVWPTKDSIFLLTNNEVKDIGRADYHTKLYPALTAIGPAYETDITGVIDRFKQQYYFQVNGAPGDVNKTYVFSFRTGKWIGTNSFTFDRYTSSQNNTYGHRDMKTYKLNTGYIINDVPVEFKVKTGVSPEQVWNKEFISIRVNSNEKPTNISFFKEKNGIPQCSLNQTLQGSLYLRNRNGWSQLIPRTFAAVNPSRPLLQGRLLIYEISHNLATAFKITDVATQYKKIKLP